MIANTARLHCPDIANRIPVSPAHSAAAVIALGSSALSVRPRGRFGPPSNGSSSVAFGPRRGRSPRGSPRGSAITG